jgi:hypothetical protein
MRLVPRRADQGGQSMDGERQRPRGAAASISLSPEDKIGAAPRQLDLWSAEQATNNAFKAVQAAIGRLGHTGPSIDKPQEQPPSGEGAQAKFLLIDRVGAQPPAAAPTWDHDIRADDAPGMSNPFPESRRFRPAVVAGAILVVLGLGWAGGWASYRLLGDAPAATSIKQTNVADCASEPGKNADCAALKSDRDLMPSAGTTGKIAATPPTTAARGHDPSRGSVQQANAATSRDLLPAPANASSPAPAGAKERVKASSRPTAPVTDTRLTAPVTETRPTAPVPETRPTTIEGWVVREVVGGTAVLQGPEGVWRAKAGDTVPGVGRVDSIVRWGSRWIVATSRGLISTQN